MKGCYVQGNLDKGCLIGIKGISKNPKGGSVQDQNKQGMFSLKSINLQGHNMEGAFCPARELSYGNIIASKNVDLA